MKRRIPPSRLMLIVSALVAAPAALRAGPPGTIDTTGATLATGAASVRGAVVIDGSAALGAAPNVATDRDLRDDPAFPSYWWSSPTYAVEMVVVHRGLGGPDIAIDEDLTFPGGVYDFGSLALSEGATVTFTGPASIRTTGDVRIDGRIELEGAGALSIDCAGRATFVGHDADGGSGVFADAADAEVVVAAGRGLDVSADADAAFVFSAAGDRGRVTIACDDGDAHLADAVIASGAWRAESAQTSSVQVARGDAVLDSCTATGGRLGVLAHFGWDNAVQDAVGGEVWISGGSFPDLWVTGERGVEISGGATVEADAQVHLMSGRGGVRILDGATISAPLGIHVATDLGSLTIGSDTSLTITGETPPGPYDAWEPYLLVASLGDTVTIESGATIDDRSRGPVLVQAQEGVTISGTIRSAGRSVGIQSFTGDVELSGGADLDVPNAPVVIWAGGAFFAQGGQAQLSAPEYDIRCVTGDLDLDVESMEATSGRIVALSKGLVRLRGTYRAARDIQVLSTLDSVDVRGATLATADVGASLSGFIRLATYAPASVVLPIPADGDDDWSDDDDDDDAAKAPGHRSFANPDEPVAIDATDSTLATGDSDVRSGDVLIQVAASSDPALQVVLKAGRARARRMPDGSVVTDVAGRLAFRGPRPHLDGSTRITAGSVSRRVYLDGGRGTATSASGTVEVTISGKSRRRASVRVRLTEPTATSGTAARLGLDRAGLHARTTFRRPKAKGR